MDSVHGARHFLQYCAQQQLHEDYMRRGRPGLVKGRGNALFKEEGDQREKQVAVENTRFWLLWKMEDNLVLVGKDRETERRETNGDEKK